MTDDRVVLRLCVRNIRQPVAVARCLLSHGVPLRHAHASLCTLAQFGTTSVAILSSEIESLTTELNAIGVSCYVG